MILFPAIDLLGGKVVRLYQGDFEKKQEFGDDPIAFAKQFEQAGATHLHVVDLDGAKAGNPQNFGVARQIAEETGLFVELGGGIRDAAAVRRCISAGIDRVILGTSALRNPVFAQEMVAQYGDKIAVGVDARDGFVAVEGWLSTSEVESISFCAEMHRRGVKHIIYTDISKDGTGTGTNLEAYRKLAEIEGLEVTASGGVTTLDDIAALRDMGLYGAILGSALYKGSLKLDEALRAARGDGEAG